MMPCCLAGHVSWGKVSFHLFISTFVPTDTSAGLTEKTFYLLSVPFYKNKLFWGFLISRNHAKVLDRAALILGESSISSFLTWTSWPTRQSVIFPEFLLSRCQYLHIQDYAHLICYWCDTCQSSWHFLLGQSHLALGEHHKAFGCFLKAAKGIGKSREFQDRSTSYFSWT